MSKRLLPPEQMGHPSEFLADLGIKPQQPGEDSLEAQQRIDREVAEAPREKKLAIYNQRFRSKPNDS